MAYKILIVEDDLSFGTMLQTWFKRNDSVAVLCHGVAQAKKEFAQTSFDLVLADLRLPDGDGILLLTWINEQRQSPPVIIMTSYGDIQTAVASMKLGAYDYMEKPINPHVLKHKIEQALEEGSCRERQTKKTKGNPTPKEMIYGESEPVQEMYHHLMKVAPTPMTVLITGESGSGKEYVAQTIHQNSKRSEAPFIAVDCGGLSRELAPSELFGHLKGSFTSAISDKKGVFELADGGTVFLDEVGNLPYQVQMQLLRALQEMRVRPVGSAQDIEVDVRIIAATNEDLEQAIAENRFREDLYHRLNEFPLHVVPLRERGRDILIFAEHFLKQANIELEKQVSGFTEEASGIILRYRWPGNLREMRNVVRRATLFAEHDKITADDLPASLSEVREETQTGKRDTEREQIEQALSITQGNKTKAARLLGIDRKTLYNKMHHYGMDLQDR